MARKDLPDPVGKCPLCTINLYDEKEFIRLVEYEDDGKTIKVDKRIYDDKGREFKEIVGKPMIFPCGIYREKQGRCPWETEADQKELTKMRDFEKIAGLLGTMHTND